MTSGVGTPFYMAPEMVNGAKHKNGAVDVYSFGIMAAQVMVGKLVYNIDELSVEGLCLVISHKQPTQCVFTLFLLLS